MRAHGPEVTQPTSFIFELRRMTPVDLESVLRVERLAFQHPWSRELFERELLHDWSTILLAVPPDTSTAAPIYGFVIYWLVHDEVHILNVAVDPHQRRRGIARRLMLGAIEQGRGHCARLVTLEVRQSNMSAIALYSDLGFRAVGTRPNYYQDEGEDAVVMNLNL